MADTSNGGQRKRSYADYKKEQQDEQHMDDRMVLSAKVGRPEEAPHMSSTTKSALNGFKHRLNCLLAFKLFLGKEEATDYWELKPEDRTWDKYWASLRGNPETCSGGLPTSSKHR